MSSGVLEGLAKAQVRGLLGYENINTRKGRGERERQERGATEMDTSFLVLIRASVKETCS